MGELLARTGETRAGLPVSVNVAPPPDRERFVARFFVSVIDQPADGEVEDILFFETAMVRVLVRGRWAARLEVLEGAWGDDLVAACADIADIDDHAGTVDRLVAAVRARVATMGASPDPAMEEVERIARTDSTMPVAEMAGRLGLSPRVLKDRVRAHFGHVPKTVLRRSRFLDMAAVMRGLAVPDTDALAAMRFYDASHLNREFRLIVDVTPARFERAATPLITPGLEVCRRRKLQELGLPAAPSLAGGSNGEAAR